MLKLFKEITGPALFTEGLLKLKENKLHEAKRLVLKAAENFPDLKNDPFHDATLILIESKLTGKWEEKQLKAILESLENSPYENTNDYRVVVDGLKEKIENQE